MRVDRTATYRAGPTPERPASPPADPRQAHTARDFMSVGFDLIREPLNLGESGQAWFGGVYRNATGRRREGLGVVLGATAWLAALVHRSCEQTTVVDRSPIMLDMARASLCDVAPAVTGVTFLESDWMAPRIADQSSRIVTGDNSLMFLRYPEGWRELCDRIAEGMQVGGRLITRVCSLPRYHRRMTVQQIVAHYESASAINLTEVRAALLFAHVIPELGYCIDTEAALDTFEECVHEWEPLLTRVPPEAGNDLWTIKKYRGSGAKYYVPPLEDVLNLLACRFRVESVCFGPYPMSEFFPLVVAARR